MKRSAASLTCAVISEPPCLRKARQAIHVHIFYSNHFKQANPGRPVRPHPLSPWPPCGASGMPKVTGHVIDHDSAPARRDSAIRRPQDWRRRSRRWRKGEWRRSFARATASSAFCTVWIARTGPNEVSSCMRRIEWSTSTITDSRNSPHEDPQRAAADQDARSLGLGLAKLRFDAIEVTRAGSWVRSSFSGSPPGPSRSNFVLSHATLGETRGNSPLDVDSLDGDAGLPAVGEAAPDGRARGGLEVRVRQDDHGVLAAEAPGRTESTHAVRKPLATRLPVATLPVKMILSGLASIRAAATLPAP